MNDSQTESSNSVMEQVVEIPLTFSSDTLRKYFPRSYTPQKMQDTIIKLLEQWQRKRQQQQQR